MRETPVAVMLKLFTIRFHLVMTNIILKLMVLLKELVSYKDFYQMKIKLSNILPVIKQSEKSMHLINVEY